MVTGALGDADPSSDARRNPLRVSEAAPAVVFLLLTGVIAAVIVNKQFGGYDLSPLIDLAWRLKQGQVPNSDFITTFPLGFIVMAKALGQVTSLSWLTYTYLNVLISVGAYLLSVLILTIARARIRGAQWLLAIAFSLPLVYTNHVWHSSYSQLLASAFLLNVYLILRSDSIISAPLVVAMGALLSLTKQNVGLPIFFVTVMFLALTKKPIRIRAIVLVSIGFLSGMLLSGLYLGLTLPGFLYLFTGGSSRIIPSSEMIEAISQLPTTRWISLLLVGLLCLLVVASFISRPIRKQQVYLLLIFGAGAIPFLTDWDAKVNNLPILLVCAGLYILDSGSQTNAHAYLRIGLWVILAFMFIAALYGGLVRERMAAVGPFHSSPATMVVYSRLFPTGLQTGDHLAAISHDLRRLDNEGFQRIFFGPRMEFAYYEIGAFSPRGLPLYWFPGTSFALSDINRIEENFISSDFDTLVFFDFTRIPEALKQHVDSNYVRDTSYESLLVLRRVR